MPVSPSILVVFHVVAGHLCFLMLRHAVASYRRHYFALIMQVLALSILQSSIAWQLCRVDVRLLACHFCEDLHPRYVLLTYSILNFDI